jgi:hypothetical protein
MPKGDPVPEAIYHIRCDKATYKESGPTSKNPGSPMAECMFTIFGPEDAEEFHGRKIFENFMLSGEGLFRTRQYFESAGESEDFTLEDTDQFLQREVAAVVGIEKEKVVDGKTYGARNRILRFQAIE